MPSADTFDAPQGAIFHGTLLQAISEAFVGNGIQNDGDAAVTADPNNALTVDVSSATDLRFDGSSYSPASASLTISSGPSTETNGEFDRRVDAVVFDSTAPGYTVLEGSPSPTPTPPSIGDPELMLALIQVGHNVSDIVDDDVLDWRAHAAVDYEVETSEVADAAVTTPKVADSNITTAKVADSDITTTKIATDAVTAAKIVDGLNTGFVGTDDAQSFGALFDFGVTSSSPVDTTHSYTLALDSSRFVEIRADSDGSGGIKNAAVKAHEVVDVNGNDITDGSATVWSSSNGHVPREQIDDRRTTTTVTSTTHTTAGGEVILVDTSTIAAASTITLSSADAENGNVVTVADSGGLANDYPITIDTEGAETIVGQNTTRIESDGGATVLTSDGTNWSITGGSGQGGVMPSNIFAGREGGTIADGDDGILEVSSLPDGQTVAVYAATLVTAGVQAVPSGVNMSLVTFDNAGGKTVQSSLITGDGSTVFDLKTGMPLGSYTNTSGSPQSVGVVVPNGSGSSVDVLASIEGEVDA